MIDLIYIAGWGRSGSTALERALQAEPGVTGLGELENLWQRGWVRDEKCACGEPFSQCPFWQEVLDEARQHAPLSPRGMMRMQRRLDSVPKLALRTQRASERRAVSEYVMVLDAVLRSSAHVAGTRVLVDSSKSAAHMILLSTCPSVRLHVVHVVREPVDVARSWRQTRSRPEANDEQPFMARIPAHKVVANWLARNYSAEVFGKALGTYTLVKQADLRQDITGQAQKILAQVAPVRPTEPEQGTTSWHSVSGNPSRFGAVPPGSDETSWRTELSDRAVGAMTIPGRRRWLR